MKRNQSILVSLCIILTAVVVVKVGMVGLFVLPLLFAQIATLVWGKSPSQRKELGVRRPPDDDEGADRDELENLVSAAKGGDDVAWHRLVEEIQPQIRKFANVLCKTAPAVISPEDLEANFWLHLVRKISWYQSQNFLGWAWTVMHNRFIDELRRYKRQPRVVGDVTKEVESHYLAEVDDAIELIDWFDGLRPESAFVFFLREICKHRWNEVADEMNRAFPMRRWTTKACQQALNEAVEAKDEDGDENEDGDGDGAMDQDEGGQQL